MKWFKNNWGFLLAAAIVLGLFLLLLFDGIVLDNSKGQDPFWSWGKETISALLGAAVVATITFFLMKGQANSQEKVEHSKKVFENKLTVFQNFLSLLEEVVINNKVTTTDERKLQFCVATIAMHASSEDILVISKNLKHIIEKIRTPERVDGTIWNELMDIVNIFQHSLYAVDKRELDVNMRKSLRNFSSLCQNTEQEILEFIDCMIASYNFNTFISDHCLFIEIPVKRTLTFMKGVPPKIFLTVLVKKKDTVTKDGEQTEVFSGMIAYYCKNEHKNKIDQVYEDSECWNTPSKPDFKLNLIPTNNLEMGINKIEHAMVFNYEKQPKMHLQVIVCDLINFISPVWASEGQAILRKDKEGKIIKEIPLRKKEEQLEKEENQSD